MRDPFFVAPRGCPAESQTGWLRTTRSQPASGVRRCAAIIAATIVARRCRCRFDLQTETLLEKASPRPPLRFHPPALRERLMRSWSPHRSGQQARGRMPRPRAPAPPDPADKAPPRRIRGKSPDRPVTPAGRNRRSPHRSNTDRSHPASPLRVRGRPGRDRALAHRSAAGGNDAAARASRQRGP